MERSDDEDGDGGDREGVDDEYVGSGGLSMSVPSSVAVAVVVVHT